MAKRKRLTPARPDQSLEQGLSGQGSSLPGPFAAPIARVAGDAATSAALEEVSEVLRTARAEGRLIQRIPLDQIVSDYLVRDRLVSDGEDLEALIASLRARGQQTPIEVTDLGEGLFGLISGSRRITALRLLQAETGEDRFGSALALLRVPAESSEAYVAMVEENEIRVGLSYYERARITLRATEAGVYADTRQALQGLFASASRAKRSKIGSFIRLIDPLDGALAFPAAIGERLGLALSKALEEAPRLGETLRHQLTAEAPQTAEAELTILHKALSGQVRRGKDRARVDKPARGTEIRPGVYLERSGKGAGARVVLSGPQVDARLCQRLEDWLRSEE